MSKPKIQKIKTFGECDIWMCCRAFFEIGYGYSPVKAYSNFLRANHGRDF